jgi:hypothetical protein
LRLVGVLAAATLVLVATVAKTGTYLNVIVAAEPAVVALGVAGTAWLLRSCSRDRAARAPGAIVCAAWLLSATQVVAFVVHPTHPGVFVRPRSAPAHAWVGRAQLAAAVRQARACPAGAPYSGAPFVAFAARRRMPGDEPDQFLMMTPAGAAAARAAAADQPRCPG